MSKLTAEQIDHIYELSKDDRTIIVGSEIRQLCSLAKLAVEQAKSHAAVAEVSEVERFYEGPMGIMPASDGEYVKWTDYDLCRTALTHATRAKEAAEKIITEKNGELSYAESRVEAAEKEVEQWKTWGTIEVAIRNPNVSSSMHHWENRALAAEQRAAAMEANDRRYQWLSSTATLRFDCGSWKISFENWLNAIGDFCRTPNDEPIDCEPKIVDAAIDAAIAAQSAGGGG